MPEIQYNNNVTAPSVLITGGSGLVGRYLTSALLSEGFNVSHLSRGTNQFGKVRVFRWDPSRGILDRGVFDGIDYVINLSGANLGQGRWTEKRKKEILSSRVDSIRLLHNVISDNGISLKAFITASAIGYYGTVNSEEIFTESDQPGTDFLAIVCRKWEEAADLFSESGIRTVKIRAAVVLEKNDSVLSRMMKPAKSGFLVQTGNGGQYMPWIHITDLCNIYIKAINDQVMTGPYNAASPEHVTLKEFMNTLSLVMNRPVFPIHVPAWQLKIIFGEMAGIILKGSRISSDKIKGAGYHFLYSNLRYALENVINM